MTYLAEEMDVASIGFGMGLYISGNAIGGTVTLTAANAAFASTKPAPDWRPPRA